MGKWGRIKRNQRVKVEIINTIRVIASIEILFQYIENAIQSDRITYTEAFRLLGVDIRLSNIKER